MMTEAMETDTAQNATGATEPVLSVDGLSAEFRTRTGIVRAVDGMSFDLHKGETPALVGESGSGKSVTSLSIMGLLPAPAGYIAEGRVTYAGRDLAALSDREMRKLRGADLAMIFQEPLTSLNPVLPIGRQMTEGIMQHLGLGTADARARAIEMMRRVSIPSSEARLKDYPHQYSGGMLQHIMIAIAMSCDPKVLIADEPTTALDVTIQAQILELRTDLRDRTGASMVLITHDRGWSPRWPTV